MKIREFTTVDQLGVNKLQDEFMQEFFPEFYTDPRQYQWNADIYDIDKYYLQHNGRFWVVEEEEDNIIGVGGFRLVNLNIAEIKRIRIKACYRGKGLGKAIIHTIEDYCRRNHIIKILVDTDQRLTTAKTMYEKMGYSVYKTEAVEEGSETYINYYFQKDLSQV